MPPVCWLRDSVGMEASGQVHGSPREAELPDHVVEVGKLLRDRKGTAQGFAESLVLLVRAW